MKNPILEKRFQAKRIEFKRHNFPDDVVFAFHGTKPENIDSIAKENLTIILDEILHEQVLEEVKAHHNVRKEMLDFDHQHLKKGKRN